MGAGLHLVARVVVSSQGVSGGSRLSLLPHDKKMLRGQAGRRQAVGIYTLHFVFMGLSSVWSACETETGTFT